jgi:N-acyl-D-aspartate/D-glutamate deacylase
MGAAAQEREATPEEIEAMQRVVREGMMAGALGFSVGNFVGQGEGLFGVKVPSSVATDGGARPDKGDRTDYSTRLLSHWVRDRQVMSLEEAVYRMTGKTALMHDLHDRGFLSPGKAADITIFDPDTIGPKPREPLYEFPGGEMHVKQGAVGIDYVIVNGEVLLDHGEYTGALPGQTLRSPLYCGKRESVS